jgi:uncharacterized protein with PIN domain
MEPALLGLVLDSSAVIAAEREQQSVFSFIGASLRAHGPVELSLSPVTVAELVHGIQRAKTPEGSRRRRAYGGGWATDQHRPKHHSAIQKRERFALQMTHRVSIVVVSKPHTLGA